MHKIYLLSFESYCNTGGGGGGGGIVVVVVVVLVEYKYDKYIGFFDYQRKYNFKFTSS
jgi:hypothetical protein